MTETILLVDDDPTLRRLLGDYLRAESFVVDQAASGQEALRQAYQQRPALVVMDVMMPGMDGFEASARLRELTDVPIILLTAKNDEADKLRGFRVGVDDYVTKPFSFAELTARIRAILARARPATPTEARVHRLGAVEVDRDRRVVQRAGQPVALTATEFRLLETLLARAGQAVSEAELTREVWGDYKTAETGGVRRYVWLLRQKLEEDPTRPALICTVRGYGYRLDGLQNN
ncbi:MAG TPA: response regulator transcription factor [Anaerolineales bacterium]|nr:response regulator transcription factor [Anaerolineales bacterium]